MTTGNWAETCATLAQLSADLCLAVNTGNQDDAFAACKEILRWGGNRNPTVGALPFLTSKCVAQSLCNYLQSCKAAFVLNEADTTLLMPPVENMNAMLTKVHALNADDGLPIYDSRVAAAIGSLVEGWRVSACITDPVPAELAFPSTAINRTVWRLFPDAQSPGHITYTGPDDILNWAVAKVRLGWLLEALANRSGTALKGLGATVPQRMRALEAALFMIGYDVRCLAENFTGASAHGAAPAGLPRWPRRRTQAAMVPPAGASRRRSVMPLSGRGTLISYRGDLDSGFEVRWGNLSFPLQAGVIEEIETYFAGCRDVRLEARRDGAPRAGSFGRWLLDAGWPSPQYGSAVAAILREEGLLEARRHGGALMLSFKDPQVERPR